MSRASLFALLVPFSLLHLACSSDSSSSGLSGALVADTLGNVYTVSCSTFCTLTPKDSSVKALSCNSGDGTDSFVLTGSQILTVHALLISSYGTTSFSAADPARPVACTSDADCIPGLSPAYACQNGLCQRISATSPLTTVDVLALCQADIPWPKECFYLTDPKVAARVAEVAATCGASVSCAKVPADCRQPVAVTPGLDAGATQAPEIDSGVDSGT